MKLKGKIAFITGGASGSGSGPVAFSAAPNAGTDPRIGTIDVQGQTYTFTQFGSSCAFAINPTAVNAPAGGASAGADEMVRTGRALGAKIYSSLSEIPGVQ